MKLKEYISFTFSKGVLDVFEHGKHILHQPFDSETSVPFLNSDAAMAWLVHYYPDLFTPS